MENHLETAKRMAADLGREILSEVPVTMALSWPGRHEPSPTDIAKNFPLGLVPYREAGGRYADPFGDQTERWALQVGYGQPVPMGRSWMVPVIAFRVGPTAAEIAEKAARAERVRRQIEDEQS